MRPLFFFSLSFSACHTRPQPFLEWDSVSVIFKKQRPDTNQFSACKMMKHAWPSHTLVMGEFAFRAQGHQRWKKKKKKWMPSSLWTSPLVELCSTFYTSQQILGLISGPRGNDINDGCHALFFKMNFASICIRSGHLAQGGHSSVRSDALQTISSHTW